MREIADNVKIEQIKGIDIYELVDYYEDNFHMFTEDKILRNTHNSLYLATYTWGKGDK